jgi:hypothetical protein
MVKKKSKYFMIILNEIMQIIMKKNKKKANDFKYLGPKI